MSNETFVFAPDLTCVLKNNVLHSINSAGIPSWIVIENGDNEVTMEIPELSEDVTYQFDVLSTLSPGTDTFLKSVTVNILATPGYTPPPEPTPPPL